VSRPTPNPIDDREQQLAAADGMHKPRRRTEEFMPVASKAGFEILGDSNWSVHSTNDAADRSIQIRTAAAMSAWRDTEPRIPTETMIDQTLEHSFPASDPPSWTLGI
jgi:hypothetical protein